MNLIGASLNGTKRAIARTICLPIIGNLLSATFQNRIPSNGVLVDTTSPLIDPSIKAMLFWGLYERAERRFIRKYLRSDLDVIELGSSLGITTCQIRKNLLPQRRLFCVEANPSLIELIRTNLSLNQLVSNVVVLNKAVDYGPSNGSYVSFAPGADTLAGRVSQTDKENGRVETTTLSGLIEGNALDDLTLVSDIEGSEAGIIFNDATALQKCRQIIIELHDTLYQGRKVTAGDLRDYLVGEHGFVLRDEHGPVCVFER